MNKMSCVFVAVLAFGAASCKKKGGAADCDAAINHSMNLSKDSMQKMGVDAKTMQQMKDLGVQHCKEDKWSADTLKCMTDAKTETDAQACYGKLSTDQQEKMNKAAMALQPTAPDHGSAAGSAAAGSDTGSGSASK